MQNANCSKFIYNYFSIVKRIVKLYINQKQINEIILNSATIYRIYIIHAKTGIYNLKQYDNKVNCHFSTLAIRVLTKININKYSIKNTVIIVQNK